MVAAPGYMTTAEAAGRLDVTPKHVVWLIHHGHLDGKRWLRMWMVERSSVETWRKQRHRQQGKH
jgi:excisionase family DNA binding protein